MSRIDEIQARVAQSLGREPTSNTTSNTTASRIDQAQQNVLSSFGPRVLDNPTPYATYTTPEPQQVSTPAPVQTNMPTQQEIDWGKQYGFLSDDMLKEMYGQQKQTTTTTPAPTLIDNKISRDGFAMDEELGAKHGSYENYLNNIVTDEYKRKAIAEANAEKTSTATKGAQLSANPLSGAYLAWGQAIVDNAKSKYEPKQEDSSEMTQKQKDAHGLVSQSEMMASIGKKLVNTDQMTANDSNDKGGFWTSADLMGGPYLAYGNAVVNGRAPSGYEQKAQEQSRNAALEAASQNFRTTQEYNDYLMRKYDLETEAKQLETSAVGFQAAQQTVNDIMARYDELFKPNYGAGNIDLSATPRFDNGDGTYSSVDSMSFYDEKTGLEILIPTVVQIDGQWYHLNQEQAIDQYRQTGKYLGAFRTPEDANAYAIQLHEQQERLFSEREKMSAQIKAAQETAEKEYGQWSSGPLATYQANRSKFLMEYDYPQFLRESRDNIDYDKATNILEGLDLKVATLEAGTPKYDLAVRQRDQLQSEIMTFASYDKLEELYHYYAGGINNVESKINDIYAKMQERIELDYKNGVDTATDWGTEEEPGYARLEQMLKEEQAKVSEEDKIGLAAGAELARRDAEGMFETTKGTSAEKLFDELAYYSVYGDLSDKSTYSKVSKLKKDLKKELEKTGKYTEKQINNAVEELSRRGNAIRTENMQNNWSLVGTGAAGIIPGIAMTVLSFATNLASIGGIAEALRSTYNGSTIRTMDPNSSLMWGVNATNALRSAVTDAVDLNIGGVDVFDEAYGIATSSIDSMIAAYVPGNLGGAVLGMSAAAQGMNEAARNGASIGEAVMTGIVNGVNEMLWESLSISQFKALQEAKVLTFSDFAKNMGKSFATNFSEEAMTELANVMFDYYSGFSTSNYNLAVADYMEQGYSEEEAASKVRADLAWQIVKAGVTGGLQGIIMGFTGQAISLHAINQVNRFLKTSIAENDFLANTMLARQYKEGSQARRISERFLTRLNTIIESDATVSEKKSQLTELLSSYQTQAAQLPELMVQERAEYAPESFTEAMHKAILTAVESGKENTIHMETPTETRVREAQTAAGMSQETIDATKALLFDVVSGRTDLRAKSVSGTVLTSPAFKDVVFELTGERLTGGAADIRRQLQAIADKKANRTITIGDAPTPVQTQDNLVEPTPVQPTAPGEVNLSDIVKPNPAAAAQTQTTNQNPQLQDITNRMLGYNRADTAGTPAEVEYGNDTTPETALSSLSYNMTNESAIPAQTAEAVQSNVGQRAPETAQAAADATVEVGGEKLTEAQFVASATEAGDITEAQAKEAFRQLASGEKTVEDLDDKVRFAISQAEEKAETRAVQKQAAEQGITEYQYLVQEITNILSGADGVKVKFVSGPEMAQLNGMMDLKTGELYVNANAPAVNANAMNGIAFVLGHEGLHAADESLKAQGKQTLTDRMLGWEDKDGFHQGMLQRLEAAGALTGKYAEVGRALSELNKLVAEIKETYQNYYRNTKGWSQDRIDKVITDDYIRGEVAGDLLGNLLGVNWEQQSLGFGGSKFSRPDLFKLMAGIDDQPLQAAEMTLRERLKAQREANLRGKAFQDAYNTTQSELRSLLKDMQEALKDFTPAIDHIADSLAEDNIEDATRYSLSSLANAAGFTAVEDEETGQRYFVRTDGTRVTRVTADDIKASPIGMLVSYASERGYLGKDKAQNAANAEKQYQFFADVCTLAASNNDFAMSMQFVGSVTFTAIKANSDTQYKTTYDFKSVCIKTQACIDQMSAAMVAKKGGLTKEETLEIYRAANEIGLPVPCPECYVWNRWIGIGGLLDNMWNYQNRYGSMSFDEVKAAYDTMHDRVAAKAEEAGLSFGKAKTKLTAQITKQYQNLLDRIEKKTNQGDKVSKADQAKLGALKDTMTDVKALTWIEDVYFGGRPMTPGNISQNYAVPADILFDLNRGAEFATQYKDAWAFRTTQGAGYGKAITPYAEASLGEGIMASAGSINTVVKDKASGKLKNIILDSNGTLTEDVKKVLDKAVKKQKAQLFRGGQRFNSTSDAANDVASDYLLAMLEMQTMNGGVQIYTKVDGAVEYLSNVGAFINQSLMPLGGGLDSNGKILDTSVGGMSPSAAFANRDKYENAGTITIGVNDAHIRAMYGDQRRDFIIPYHASGGDANVVAESRAIQDPSQGNATRVRSTDYTRTQGEKVLSDKVLQWLGKDEAEIEQIHKNRAARLAILTGKSVDMSVVRSNPILSELYDRFHGGKWDGVTLSKGEVEKNIYPNEYWDTETTYETSGLNTETYLQYCEDLGFLHKFAGVVPRDGQLKAVTGYNQFGEKVNLTDLAYVYDENGNKTDQIEDYFWKNLVDRRMYGWDGQYLDQTPINLTNLGADQVRDFAKYNTGRSYDQAKSARLAEQMRKRFSQNAEEGQRLSLAVGQNGVDSEGNEYEFTDMPKYQDHTSAGTSLPSNAPTVYKAVTWEPGTKNLDIGGGRTEFANNYLAERDVKNNILDPYNRDADYNLKAIDSLVNEGKYDTVTCANVLNVIDSAQSRRNVILEAAKALKPDGTAYFQIYEGDKKGGGRETSKGFQVNQKTAEYLDEVKQWFNNVQQWDYNTKTGAFRPSKSGNIIVATGPKENLPKAYWEYEEGKAVRYSISNREANVDYNNNQTEIGSPLRTKAYTGKTGGNIERMGGVVGKNLGTKNKPWVYFHRNYLDDAMRTANINKADYDKAFQILQEKNPGLAERFNHVTYNAGNNSFTFGYSPDFDTAREPVAGEQMQVFYDTGKTTYKPNNKQIFHHKWLWVEDDYDGFDVKDAWEWSKQWLNTLEPTTEVGGGFAPKGVADGTNIDAWNRQLDYFGLPRDTAAQTPEQRRDNLMSDVVGRMMNDESRLSLSVSDQAPGRNYRVPENYGAFVRNTGQHYVDRIFSDDESQRKTVETRKDRTLDAFLHKRMPIINTETHQVIGDVYVDDVIQYTDPDDFNADYNRHWVPATDKQFGWTKADGTTRYGYVLSDPQRYDTPIPLDEGYKKYSRIGAELPSGARERTNLMSDVVSRMSLAITPQENAEYERAAETGDRTEARRLVNEAAKRWGAALDKDGNPLRLYHGSKHFGFTKFILDAMDDKSSIFLTDNKYVAESYSGGKLLTGTPGGVDGEMVNGVRVGDAYTMPIDQVVEMSNDMGAHYEQWQVLDKAGLEKLIQKYLTETHEVGEQAQRMIENVPKMAEVLNLTDSEQVVVDFVLQTIAKFADANTPSELREADEAYKKAISLISNNEKVRIPLMMLDGYILANSPRLAASYMDKRSANDDLVWNGKTGVLLGDQLREELHEDLISEIDTPSYNTLSGFNPEPKRGGIYELFAKFNNPLVVSADETPWNSLMFMPNELKQIRKQMKAIERRNTDFARIQDNPEWAALNKQFWDIADELENKYGISVNGYNTTREISAYAKDNGYDSVIFEGIIDNGEDAYDEYSSNVYIIFNPADAKSADDFTYDDNGNVIPLSERFSPQNEFRYSLSMNQTNSNTDAKRNAQIQDIVRNVMANAPQQTTTQGRDTSVGAARFGFTNQVIQDFVDWQRAAKDHHTISDEQLNNTTFNRAQRGAIQYRKTVDKTGAVSSRAAQTIRNAPTTTDAVAQSIDQAVASGEFKHIPYGDQAALKDATKAIERNGWNDEYAKYKANVDDGITSKKNTVMGIALYNNAVTAGDTYAALDIAALLIKNASNTGASLQAQRLLNNLGPDGKLYMAVRGIENIADSIRKLYPGKQIEVSKNLLQAYRDALVADDKAAIETARKDIYQEIANQLPADWKEQFNNWRYMAMLTNPATHFRNVLGNAGFAVPRLMKQAIKAGLERAKYGRAGEGSNRTTTILNLFSAADRSRFAAGMKDYNDVVDLIQSGGKQTGPKDEIEKLRTIFHIKDHELKGLEAIRKGNTTALDWEDTLFSRPAYAEALASYLKARGIDGADYAMGNISAQDKLAAQKHAILEAQKATYRDRNQFSDLVASIGKNARRADATTAQKIAGVAGEAILPFKRTPANIMARAWEYSPAEFINVLFSDIGKIRHAQASTKAAEADSDGSEEALRAINDAKAAESEMVTDMFDHIASATTGTLLLIAGAFLRHMGILHGGDDDDEDQAAFDKLQGQQEYSINIGNKNYTLDWLAPEVLPMFTGVALYDKLIDRDDEDGNGIIGDLSNAMLGLTEPMLNMSMLSSVSDLISNIKNLDQAEQIPAIAKNIGLNYLSQYVPTLSGKIESIASTPNRTSTYIDKESPFGSNEQYFLGRLSNKIPRWDYNQITYYDAWGRPQENGNVLQRAVANLVSPGYLRKDASTPYDEELQRLYDVNHEFKVLPQRASQSQKVDKTFLTAEEYELYTKTQGETQYRLIGELLDSSAYKKMTDAEKAKAISEVYSEAKIAAANAVRDLRGVEVEASDSAKAGLDPVQFTVLSSVYDNAETPSGYEKTSSGKSPKWAKMLGVINDSSFSTTDRLAYVNAMSGRTTEYKTLDEAKEYYEGEKEKNIIQPEWYKTASNLYKNAVTPDGYNTTESGNTPTWVKMLSILDDKSLSKDQKLKFINEKSGLKEEFKTLDEARKHYEDQKKKNKKK